MLGKEQSEDRPSGGVGGGGGGVNRKTYLRSASWTDRSPRTPNPRPQSNSKARLCLPTLPPLSISQRSHKEWPRAGSDDLGIWPQAPTPGVKGPVKELQNSDTKQPEREFEFKKDKLAFFDKKCSRISDHVYLGSDAVAKNREILRQNGITHVLNCVGFVCPEYFKNELVYKTLWLQDSPSEDITSILYDVFDYFEDVREQGGRVLVHCCQGVSRSTSLVIAYLMWREKQTFEDAFQYVKAARGVTNPNMGFACQLQTLAFLASPNSVLRMYRMAPHSPYDPLHLVPKMLTEPGAQGLDSRGAFIVRAPSAVYVWIGKYCASIMSDSAKAAAFQLLCYEMAQGPVVTVHEGKEPPEFWAAFVVRQLLADDCKQGEIKEEGRLSAGNDKLCAAACPGNCERKVDLYDLDFDMFHKALAGGVVPPFPLSGTRLETCLPARENGWGRLRRKFASVIMKEFITSSMLTCDTTQSSQGLDTTTGHPEVGYPVSLVDSPLASNSKSGSSDVYFCSPTSSPNRTKDTCKVKHSDHLADPLSSPTPSFSSLDSFSSFLVNSPKFSSKSPSLSPSASDYSSSFTFSPSSSKWSDLSYLSSQSSPSGLESLDPYPASDASLGENAFSLHKETSPSRVKECFGNHAMMSVNACFPCNDTTLSIAERRGSSPPPRMMLPSVDQASQAPRCLIRSRSFSLPDLEDDMMKDEEYYQSEQEAFHELSRESTILDTDMVDAGNELVCHTENRNEYNTFHLPSSDTTRRDTEADVTNAVLYQWPTMDKVEIPCFSFLDSSSVYISFASNVHFGTNNRDVIYIWLGRDVSCEKGQMSSNGTCKNSDVQWEKVGLNFVKQMGLPLNSSVQVYKGIMHFQSTHKGEVITEGEEPEEFLKHLNCFSTEATNSGKILQSFTNVQPHLL